MAWVSWPSPRPLRELIGWMPCTTLYITPTRRMINEMCVFRGGEGRGPRWHVCTTQWRKRSKKEGRGAQATSVTGRSTGGRAERGHTNILGGYLAKSLPIYYAFIEQNMANYLSITPWILSRQLQGYAAWVTGYMIIYCVGLSPICSSDG